MEKKKSQVLSQQPVLDFDASEWLTIPQVAALLPGSPHTSTVSRWTTHKVRGRLLASSLIGGKRMVKRADLMNFLFAEGAPERAAESEKRKAVAAAQVDVLLK